MLGVEERLVLADQLSGGSPAGGPWDVVLFSGGGNDIVGNPMALWVKDFNPAIAARRNINQPRFDAALALVRAGYEDLITLRDQLSPTNPSGVSGLRLPHSRRPGICFLGPWLKPTFDLRKFPTLAAGEAVIKAMLQQFAAMLTSLGRPKGHVHQHAGHVVAADSLLAQRTSSRARGLRKVCRSVPAAAEGAVSGPRGVAACWRPTMTLTPLRHRGVVLHARLQAVPLAC